MGTFGPDFGKLGPADRALFRLFVPIVGPIRVERIGRKMTVAWRGMRYPLCIARSAARRGEA